MIMNHNIADDALNFISKHSNRNKITLKTYYKIKLYVVEMIILKMHKYFLGGATPDGFVTKFSNQIEDTDYCTYIIKGGPGTGKSSLMKKISQTFTDEEQDVYYCSADPDSYDAVVLKKHKVAFVDGTAPHVFDPTYPGAVQRILYLGDYWDIASLKKNKDNIINIQNEYSQYHLRCRRFITAISAVVSDTVHISMTTLDTEKLESFITRFAKKVMPKTYDDKKGKILFKQFSAITPKGYMTIVPNDCEIYLLNDPYYSGTNTFLMAFADIATEKGLDVVVSNSSIHKGNYIEHLYIPELNIAFISSNPINNIQIDTTKIINFMRFYRKDLIREKKARIKFNKKAVEDLMVGAVDCLIKAKSSHDKLEEYYINATNFDSINRLIYKLVSEIKSNI